MFSGFIFAYGFVDVPAFAVAALLDVGLRLPKAGNILSLGSAELRSFRHCIKKTRSSKLGVCFFI